MDKDTTEPGVMETTLFTALAKSPIPTVILSSDGKILFFNKAVEVLTGYSMIGMKHVHDWGQKLYPDEKYQNFVMENIFRVLRGEEMETSEFSFVCRDGTEKTVDLKLSLLEDGLIAQLIDITKGKEMEAKLKKAQQNLKKRVEKGSVDLKKEFSDHRKTEEELHRRDSILEAVSFAAGELLRAKDWEQTANNVLERLGLAVNVDRSYVFKNHLDEDGTLLADQVYEWTAPGVEAQMDNPDMHDFPWVAGGMGRWKDILSRGEVVHGRVKDFPESEQEILSSQDVRSALAVPIFVGEEWWGFIGFALL